MNTVFGEIIIIMVGMREWRSFITKIICFIGMLNRTERIFMLKLIGWRTMR